MESSKILADYLNSLMRIQFNVSLESFAREFPRGTLSELIEAIYNALVSQQESRQIALVQKNIQAEFEFPMQDIFDAALQEVNPRELGTLTDTLTSLGSKLRSQEKVLDMDILNKLTEINKLAEKIGESTYSERDQSDRQTITDSINGIDKLSTLLEGGAHS